MDRHRSIQSVPVPAFLYGTAWKEERTEALTRQALAAGFVGIDTANQRCHYLEAAVGDAVAAALEAGAVRREQLFLQTKFTSVGGQDHRLPYDSAADPATQVRQSCESSLAHLRTTYLDAYVLHGPSSSRGITALDWEAWRAMEGLQRAGKARLLGISNVSLAQLVTLHEGSQVKPALVQNRCHASTGWDHQVRRFCAEHGLGYQGFSLLTANARELRAPVVTDVVQRTGRSPAQVVFRFALQVGIIPLTGTTSPRHLQDDLECFDFELAAAEVEAIERVGL